MYTFAVADYTSHIKKAFCSSYRVALGKTSKYSYFVPLIWQYLFIAQYLYISVITLSSCMQYAWEDLDLINTMAVHVVYLRLYSLRQQLQMILTNWCSER